VAGGKRLDLPGGDGAQEGEELGAGARGEEGRRVCDDVRVLAAAEVEADGDAARFGVGVRVGDLRDAGRVGEADGDGQGGDFEELRADGERGGRGRGGEVAGEQDAFGVGCGAG
jgi:hypothetical protein